MRFSSSRLTALSFPLLTLACADDLPSYPPLPTYDGSSTGGSSGTNNTSGGKGGSKANGGNGGSGGAVSSTGGRSGSDNGGTGATGGNTDPLYAHCNEPWSGEVPPAGPTQCDFDALEDGGELTGDISTDRTLQSGHFYTLKGVTRVMAGKTLTIEPCVKVIGNDPDSALVVRSGVPGDVNCQFAPGTPTTPPGRIIAAGEAMAPIIFTSAKPPGSRAPGDWGGVMVLGRGRYNLANQQTSAPIEGLLNTECYGWFTDEFNDESSGKLEYVRVEYASRQSGTGLETNGLTLGGVGSGTSLHHVMVSNSNDDCFEWFGGAVSGHHLIAFNCDDDMFDADNSFSGHLQFLFGRQFPTTAEDDSRGFEIDSGPTQPEPHTTAAWSNFTVCGGGPTDMTPSSKKREGIALRSGTDGSMMNGFVTGFAAGGLAAYTFVGTKLTHMHIFNVPRLFAESHDTTALGGPEWFTAKEGNSAEDPDRFCDCWAPKPVAIPATPIQGGIPTGFEDETADYVGAFKDTSPASNWMQGLWVDWSEN